MFRTTNKKSTRPKSAARVDLGLNVNILMKNLNGKLEKINTDSKNQWNLHKITNIEVDMFNKFLKS